MSEKINKNGTWPGKAVDVLFGESPLKKTPMIEVL